MVSTPTTRLRLQKQATGDNLSTWGAQLNTGVTDLVDFAIAGWSTIALTGNYTLTSSNYVADEARSAVLKFTGTGAYSVTIPSVSKRYDVWNALTGILTITTGGATNATLQPGEIVTVICDGTNVYKQLLTDFASNRLTSLANPSGAQDAATKYYVDAQAWASTSATLPGQTGQAGKFLGTDGTTPIWQAPTVSQISDYASDQATKSATIQAADKAFAVCWALTF